MIPYLKVQHCTDAAPYRLQGSLHIIANVIITGSRMFIFAVLSTVDDIATFKTVAVSSLALSKCLVICTIKQIA